MVGCVGWVGEVNWQEQGKVSGRVRRCGSAERRAGGVRACNVAWCWTVAAVWSKPSLPANEHRQSQALAAH